jgi:hypothetical protein
MITKYWQEVKVKIVEGAGEVTVLGVSLMMVAIRR